METKAEAQLEEEWLDSEHTTSGSSSHDPWGWFAPGVEHLGGHLNQTLKSEFVHLSPTRLSWPNTSPLWPAHHWAPLLLKALLSRVFLSPKCSCFSSVPVVWPVPGSFLGPAQLKFCPSPRESQLLVKFFVLSASSISWIEWVHRHRGNQRRQTEAGVRREGAWKQVGSGVFSATQPFSGFQDSQKQLGRGDH